MEPHFNPHPVAMAEMAKSDKYAAVVFVSSKPLDPFVKRKWPAGFKFLPVPLTEKLEEYYLPAAPRSIRLSGPHCRWDERSDDSGAGRACRLRLAARKRAIQAPLPLHRLHVRAACPGCRRKPGYHAKWREMNLAANVPGWQRFRPVQEKLVASLAARLGAAPDGEVLPSLDRQLRD